MAIFTNNRPAVNGLFTGVGGVKENETAVHNTNTNNKIMAFQFTPTDNFKAIIAPKFREYYNVREAQESSLPMDGKTIQGFNIRGTETFVGMATVLTNIAIQIAQSPEATELLNKYCEDIEPQYIQAERNRIILNIAMLKAGAKLADDGFTNDVEVTRKIYTMLVNKLG